MSEYFFDFFLLETERTRSTEEGNETIQRFEDQNRFDISSHCKCKSILVTHLLTRDLHEVCTRFTRGLHEAYTRFARGKIPRSIVYRTRLFYSDVEQCFSVVTIRNFEIHKYSKYLYKCVNMSK